MGLDIAIRNNTESASYDALLEDRVVGVIVYERRGDRMIFRHTIVEPEFRGRGVASTLVRAALDDLTANRLTLTNYCGFVTEFIGEHPEYASLVDAEHPGLTPPSVTAHEARDDS
jgi:predicted GNAT family acetyltransferase